MPDPKDMPMPSTFGDLDGEAIVMVAVEVKGSGLLDRLPAPDERIVLTIEGTVNGTPKIKREGGRLLRIHAMKIDKLAEPIDELAEQVEDFIRSVEERRSGQTTLDVDPETGEVLGDDTDPDAPDEPGEDGAS